MIMGHTCSKLGLFAICLFLMILFQGCTTFGPSLNQSVPTSVTTSPTLDNTGMSLTTLNLIPTDSPENGSAYIPKFAPGDIIDVPANEVGSNLAPGFGMVTYGRWIQNISYDNKSLPIYNFALIYWNETGQWYYTGYTGWKYSAYIDQVDNATLLTHINV
jgi:hypothetical protein